MLLLFGLASVSDAMLLQQVWGCSPGLQLIPGLSMLFLLMTAAGSGMCAAKLEKKRRHEVLSRNRAPHASSADSV